MNFKNFNNKIKAQFQKMCATGKLFKSSVTGNQVWDTYISSFKPEDNGIFRDANSSEHNCNCCKNFIRRYGNIVSINEHGNLESIFSISILDVGEYQLSTMACCELLETSTIQDIFMETYEMLDKGLNYESTKKNQDTFKLGIGETHCQYTQEGEDKFGHKNLDGSYRVEFGKVYTFNHFELDLPKAFVDFSGKSIESIMATYRDKYSVFKRAMEEIPLDTLLLVKDLINQGSLLDGTSHLPVLQKIIEYKQQYQLCYESSTIQNWFWSITYDMSESVAKFKNHLIGVLCSELAEGKELNEAVLSWNKRVDPVNYNKAKAPITQAQINLAKKFVEDNGYSESFNRRLATIDDIKASEILHINRDNSKVKPVSMFDNIKTPSGVGRHKRNEFDKVEEVSIDKFMSDILSTCTNVEVLLENRMEGNLVNLTTSAETSKQIFKWNNPFSYTFNGNLAGKSQIKEAVKSAGGKVDGILRFSIMWSGDNVDNSDLDAHCIEPDTNRIYFGSKISRNTGGNLDIDIRHPLDQMPKGAVENITYPTLSKMSNGDYKFIVHQYSARNSKGFKAEIEFNGELYSYEYNQPVSGYIDVAKVTLKNGVFSIEHYLPETASSKSLWNLDTNQFHKVNLVCLTPNHWDTQIGNKHYLFMLQGCKNPNQVRGFHNEHLISELLEHRKVLDVLGNTVLCEPVDNQLAGIGFNATIKDEVILRLSGSHKRVIKLKF
jgi:hypothetical protein